MNRILICGGVITSKYEMVLPLPVNVSENSDVLAMLRDKFCHEAAIEGHVLRHTFQRQVLRPGDYAPSDYGAPDSDSALLVLTVDVVD